MHPFLNVATRAARKAGRLITRAAEDIDKVRVTRKGTNDFVTEIDQAAEAAIIEILSAAYPDHTFLAEESGFTDGRGKTLAYNPREADAVWIIDPLDGTTNFIHGLPQYAISMALMERGVVTQALIYDPNRDELYTATKGRGAFLNDRRIRVSKTARMPESLIGTGFPYRSLDDLDGYLDLFKAVTQLAAGVRRPGAASLDLAYVAAGRYDGFFELGLKPWDVAAGGLLVLEAGGLIGDFRGSGSNWVWDENLVAGTPKVFAGLIALTERSKLGAAAPAAEA